MLSLHGVAMNAFPRERISSDTSDPNNRSEHPLGNQDLSPETDR